MSLQICLANPYELHFNWKGLRSDVESLFTDVTKEYNRSRGKKPRLGNIRCVSTIELPKLGPNDLLVYVVPTPEFGFSGLQFGPCKDEDFRESHGKQCGHNANGGLTEFHGGMVCTEVYVGDGLGTVGGETLRVDRLSMDPPTIDCAVKRKTGHVARLIFHELLHNRLGKEDDMHDIPKLFLGKAKVPEAGRPSPRDVSEMAKHLMRKGHRPWTGGFDLVNRDFPRNRKVTKQSKGAA